MEDSFSKKLLMLAASFFMVAVGVCAIIVMVRPAWYENINARVTSEPYSKTISVTADGKVTVKPDIALINLSVVSQGKTVKVVIKDGNDKMTSVYEAVKALGVEEKDITSTSYNLYPNYDYSISYSTPKITGYTLDQGIQVKIRDLEKVEDVLDKAVGAGSNQIGQLSFDIDDSSGVKKEARQKAFATAKEKAQEMADAAGVKLGKVVTFYESTDNYVQPYPNYSMDMMKGGAIAESAPAATIAPGSKEFTVSVSITYEIE